MKKWIYLAIAFFILFNNVYALETNTVQQGAQQYDWQTCVNDKANDCINNCTRSEDTDCQDNCMSLAKDKCISEGISPPPVVPLESNDNNS